MSGYLERIAARSVGATPLAEPVLPPLFGPWSVGGPRLADTDGIEVADDVRLVSPRRPTGSAAPDGEGPRRAEAQPSHVPSAPPRPRPPVPDELPPAEFVPDRGPAVSVPGPATERRGPTEAAASRPVGDAARRHAPVHPAPGLVAALEPLNTSVASARDAAAGPSMRPPMAVVEPAAERRRAGIGPAPRLEDVPAEVAALPAPSRAVILPPAIAPHVPVPTVPARIVAPAPVRAAPPQPLMLEQAGRSIEISIGRIEVRATAPASRPGRPIEAHPAVSLDAYLRARAREGRA